MPSLVLMCRLQYVEHIHSDSEAPSLVVLRESQHEPSLASQRMVDRVTDPVSTASDSWADEVARLDSDIAL